MDICPSCNGVLGRDCWNPSDCAKISAQMTCWGFVDNSPLPGAGWRSDCPRCVASKFVCDRHYQGLLTHSFEVRRKPDDEGYEVWSTSRYLAATHPSGGLPIEDASLFAASDDLRIALKALTEEVCDYMRINKLGDPEEKHNIKLARAALAKAEWRE